MKILFLSSWFPYPPDNGARLRVHNLLKQLAQRHEIVLLSFARDERATQHVDQVEKYCQAVKTVPIRPFRPRHLRSLLGFFSTQPRVLMDTHSSEMQALVQRTAGRGCFDVIVASEIGTGTTTAPYVRNIGSTPCVLEDLELSMIKSKMMAQRSWGSRLRHGLTWLKQRHYAAQLLRDLDGCSVASKQEMDLVQELVPGYHPLMIVPNGVDLDLYTGSFEVPEPDTLIFPGMLTYDANFDAMSYFVGQVLPLVRAVRPEVTLRITGCTDGVPVDRLPLDEGTILTGYLDDIRPAVTRSWACVVPLRLGGGTRLKILEAMALGTPVISTSKGAEGLSVADGEDILIADTPEEFADAALRLLGSRTLRARLATNGRRLVESQYGWDGVAKRLDQLLDAAAERHKERWQSDRDSST